MVQWEPPQAVWCYLALSRCTRFSEVKMWGVQEDKISITPSNITLLTIDWPSWWCIPQTQPRVSLGWLVQLHFSWGTFKYIYLYFNRTLSDHHSNAVYVKPLITENNRLRIIDCPKSFLTDGFWHCVFFLISQRMRLNKEPSGWF